MAMAAASQDSNDSGLVQQRTQTMTED